MEDGAQMKTCMPGIDQQISVSELYIFITLDFFSNNSNLSLHILVLIKDK